MDRRRPLASLAVLALLALLTAACGRLNDSGAGDIEHPTGADELVLRVDVGGGFVAPGYSIRQIPSWSLFGDGHVITQGPQIEIYPGAALPSLLVTPISEEGVQAILEAARAAGLIGADADHPYPCIADAATTTFTLVADGRTHVVTAYALGQDQAPCQGADVRARAELADFQAKLGDLRSWLPQGSVGQDRSYEATELRIYVQPYEAVGDPSLTEPASAWPLQAPLATFGDPSNGLPNARCGVVRGADATRLLPVAREANELTPWTSEGDEFALIFRPLLPDEHAC
jgi:hypothetical protein